MRKSIVFLLMPLALAACNRSPAPAPAASTLDAARTVVATLEDARLQASTTAIAELNPTVAAHYGLDPKQDGALLLITLRDAEGNAYPPAGISVSASASTVGDPPKPLQLQSILVNGMTDYLGVFPASPPATVQFQIIAIRDGKRVAFSSNAEIYPR